MENYEQTLRKNMQKAQRERKTQKIMPAEYVNGN